MHDILLDRANQREPNLLHEAVSQNNAFSKQGLLERLFTLFFDQLVYPQIWEDPVIDLEAMAIEPGQHIVTIASGGCNVMSYLTADPGAITAVDLNPAHLALTRLKLVGARNLPCHADYARFFVDADTTGNLDLYELFIEPMLDDASRKYWSGRNIRGKRRIDLFAANFYRYGLLGRFISLAHFFSRLHGVRPERIAQSQNLAEQIRFFENELSPLFDRTLIRMLISSPVSLYGLGIPPAQYRELAAGRQMADVIRQRLKKLAGDRLLHENYFARQAFSRSYASEKSQAALPPYLAPEHWQAIKERSNRVALAQSSVTEALEALGPHGVDRVVLLDAQDWMNAEQINRLWLAITRAARPGARVIFRTAAASSPVEQKVSPSVLKRWTYLKEESAKLHRQDRSAIYGGFHLYRLAE